MSNLSIHTLGSLTAYKAVTPPPIALNAATKILAGPHGTGATVGSDGVAVLATAAVIGTGLYLGFLGFAGYGMYKFAQDYVFKKGA